MSRKVFLDVGGHLGETLVRAMDPRWKFDFIATFEPAATCLETLRIIAASNPQVHIFPFGLWSQDEKLRLHDPGTLHSSVDGRFSKLGISEVSDFKDVSQWIDENLQDEDVIWMKVNIESAEIAVLGRLIQTGLIMRIKHLVVHFDSEKVGDFVGAKELRVQLDSAGVNWNDARHVMFGRTASEKATCWLHFTHGNYRRFRIARLEHKAREHIFHTRRWARAKSRDLLETVKKW